MAIEGADEASGSGGNSDACEEIGRAEQNGGPFVAAVHLTRVPMAVTDPRQDGAPIVFVNRSIEEFSGYTECDLLAKGLGVLYGPRVDPETAQRIDTALRCDQECEVEIELRRKDGSSLWAALHMMPIHDEDGQLCYHLASFRDITRRKQAEDELRRLNAELERRVEERTRDLEAANERLSTLMRETNHRVKNSLQIASSLLSLHGAQHPDPAIRDILEQVRARLVALSRIHDLFFTATAGQETSRGATREARLDGYLRHLCLNLQTSFSGDRPDVRIEVAAPAIAWSIERILPLAMIVNELVTNAFKYAFPDSRTGRINVILDRDAEGMVLTVRDDGVGIGQTRHTRETLGLQLVSAFARQMDGTVTITEEKGTVAVVRFPEA